MGLINYLEEISMWITKKHITLSVVVSILTVVILFGDIQMHYTDKLPDRILNSIGKQFGNLAICMALLAFSYYMLREIYVLLRKKQVKLTVTTDSYVKSALTILRLIHPMFGSLLVNFAVIHAYLVWFRMGYFVNVVTYSGITTFVAITTLAILGWAMRSRTKTVSVRQKHRIMAWVFAILGIVHKFIR